MREDIKLKRYRILHKKIGEKYCTEYKSVKQCCKECSITPAVYYKICRELGKKSVNAPRGNAKEQKDTYKQQGGTEVEQKSNALETKTDVLITNNDKKTTSKPNNRDKKVDDDENLKTVGDIERHIMRRKAQGLAAF